MTRLALSVGLGLLLGWAATHALSLQWWTLAPWGLAAVALGHRASRSTAAVAGALYGFVLCFLFTLVGYTGTAPAITRVPFCTVLALVAAARGLLLPLLVTVLLAGRRLSGARGEGGCP